MDIFDALLSFGGAQRPQGDRNGGDPEVLDVQVDGEETASPPSASSARGTGSAGETRGVSGGRRGLWWRRRAVLIALSLLAVVAVVLGVFLGLARFITDVMWYGQLGFASVIWVQLGTKVGLWIAYALLMASLAYVSATLAIRARPASRDGSTIRINGTVVEVGTSISSRTARCVAVAVSALVGLAFGSQFNAHWSQILLMFHAQAFGSVDPQFGIDNGFYVFVLPGLRLMATALCLLLAVGAVFSLLTHVLMGGIRVTMPVRGRGLFSLTRRARRQLGIWLMVNMVAWALAQALSAFDSLTSSGDRFTGASYTAVHATIPVTFVMAGLTAALGIVLGVWLMRSHALSGPASMGVRVTAALKAWRVPLASVAVVVVSALLLTMLWPALLQRFKVTPNAQEMESSYIQRNIAATQEAYGLTDVKVEQYDATTEGKTGALAQDAETTAQIRLLDPQVVAPTFRQLQQSKQYYTFADTLAVDKYDIDGTSQDAVIAARELNLEGNDNRNWVNDHTVYTHGYGIVAAYGNQVTDDGQPRFFESGIPTQGTLTDTQRYEPRIYFSPHAPEYSIVGAPEGTRPWEFDYPTGSQGATNTFTGDGGPSVGNLFSRLLYAVRFGSDQILFSDRVTADSQILYERNPKDRVAKVAPYLTLDGRVYPAVVDGRVKWIVDGYTTSDRYPYAQMTDLGEATQDSTTTTSNTVQGLGSQRANYIRNSVKATVDAYDGSVDLYVWDEHDPVIKAWSQIFPGQYHSVSEISGDLMSHLRYPESLFKVQRQLLAKYHVTSASQFFSGEDFWQNPVDPTEPQESQRQDILQPPYYLTLQTGGSQEPVFSLTSTYIPAGASSATREILTGFLSVDSDAGSTTGVIGPGYGTLRLQELPKDSNVPGPGQAQNNFNANADVSKELNLLESGSTKVKRGNLLTLPVGGGLVYVEPVYVQSSGATSYPLLKKVLVAFGDQVGFADTLDEALDQVFGGNSGASAGDAGNAGADRSSGGPADPGRSGDDGQSAGTTDEGNGSASGGGAASGNDVAGSAPEAPGSSDADGGGQAMSQELRSALRDAAKAMEDADAAMKSGDWSGYGQAQQRLRDSLDKAMSLQQ